ncbi:hypothetical protein BYT27DRAFT_7007088, partial [Phlegmacium glaucopus]
HCRIYSRCRSRLVTLGCDDETLNIFRILTKDDVEASTVVLNPNIPGSTKLRLSWLWGTSGLAGSFGSEPDLNADPGIVLEFRRVHWLRARAQKLRWQEELILVTYEMQWTVRYFVQARQWEAVAENACVSAGARAYAARQETTWQRVALAADSSFR